MPINKWPFSCHNVSGVNVPNQSTSVPINWNNTASITPVPTGSLTELVAVVEKTVTAEEVNAAMEAASNESFGYNVDPIVSSDIVGISYGSLFDATQTKVITVGDKQLVKVVSWYDNEMSYTAQLVRTLRSPIVSLHS